MDQKLLSKQKVADHFDVTLTTITRWMKSGQLPFIKIGRRVLFDPLKIKAVQEKLTVEKAEETLTAPAMPQGAI